MLHRRSVDLCAHGQQCKPSAPACRVALTLLGDQHSQRVASHRCAPSQVMMLTLRSPVRIFTCNAVADQQLSAHWLLHAVGIMMLRASGLAVSQRAFAGVGSSRALLQTQRCRSTGKQSGAEHHVSEFAVPSSITHIHTSNGEVFQHDQGMHPVQHAFKHATLTHLDCRDLI
jgi:hypothetical protein